jgi:hypothetical protein
MSLAGVVTSPLVGSISSTLEDAVLLMEQTPPGVQQGSGGAGSRRRAGGRLVWVTAPLPPCEANLCVVLAGASATITGKTIKPSKDISIEELILLLEVA